MCECILARLIGKEAVMEELRDARSLEAVLGSRWAVRQSPASGGCGSLLTPQLGHHCYIEQRAMG